MGSEPRLRRHPTGPAIPPLRDSFGYYAWHLLAGVIYIIKHMSRTHRSLYVDNCNEGDIVHEANGGKRPWKSNGGLGYLGITIWGLITHHAIDPAE